MSKMPEFIKIIVNLILYSPSNNDLVDEIVYHSSWIMEIIAIVGIIIMILRNPSLKEHKRTEDRFLFYECILVIAMNLIKLSFIPIVCIDSVVGDVAFYVTLTLFEVLYLLILLQWLVFVDYNLYRSMDHIRRRYKHAILPIIIVTLLDIAETVFIVFGNSYEHWYMLSYVVYILKIVIELGYILIAVFLDRKHYRETKEPKFLRLQAFIIPFFLGTYFRYYDAQMMALGIILTYRAIKRRDRYIDNDTGLYNGDYLDYLRDFRGKKGDSVEYGISIEAKGHGSEIAPLLKELCPPNINLFALSDDRFYMLSETTKESALNMTADMIKDAIEASDIHCSASVDVVKCYYEA